MTGPVMFSIILPVCHGGRFLRDGLESLRGMEFPRDRFEVLVAGSGDDNESRGIVETESGRSGHVVKYIGCGGRNRAGRLNAACSEARGAILAFADDDCILVPDWLKKIETAFVKGPDIGAIGGTEIPGSDEGAFGLALDVTLNSFVGTGGVRRGAGLHAGMYYPRLWNMAAPRRVAEEVALGSRDGRMQVFKESLAVHEDVDLMSRIGRSGKRIVFMPELQVKHRRDTNFLSFIKRNFAMARVSRSIGIHRFAHGALSAFTLCVFILSLSSMLYRPLQPALLVMMAGYLVPLTVVSLQGLRKTGRIAVSAIIPFLVMALHASRGIGYLFPWSDKKTEVNV